MKKLIINILSILLFAQLAACGVSPFAVPVINKSPNRVIPAVTEVKKGDSLYSMAWRYGLDYRKIAKWNNIREPYVIRPGQKLRLSPPKNTQVAASPTPKPAPKPVPTSTTQVPKTKPAKPAVKADTKSIPAKKPNLKPKPPKVVITKTAPKKWNWPASGKLVSKFSRNKGNNGIKIAGTSGSPVRATAAGQVVYAGEGLRGYGKLVIVKHSTSYLSAYANNRRIMVREGQVIRANQQIAQMGKSDATRTMLHFEIRKDGKPVDPLKFLK